MKLYQIILPGYGRIADAAFHNQLAGEGGNMADAGLQQLAPM